MPLVSASICAIISSSFSVDAVAKLVSDASRIAMTSDAGGSATVGSEDGADVFNLSDNL